MKNKIFTFLICLMGFSSYGQLTNNGATIVIEQGATLIVETDIDNVSGTITNSGIIQVQGDFTNTGTLTSIATDATIVFNGAGDATFTTGGATVRKVEMDKSGNDVTVSGNLTITENLDFTSDDTKMVLGADDLILESAATITTFDDNQYVATSGAGQISKAYGTVSTFTYPVGDADGDYTPMTVDVGATDSDGTVAVNTENAVQGDVPAEATDFINRFWNVDVANFAAANTFDLSGTYETTDIEAGSDAMLIKGSHFSSDWTYTNSAGAANTVTGTIDESGDFTGTNSFGKVGLKIFLQGAYSGGTMSTSLNSLLPLTSPYDAAVTVASIPANVTDWIEIEVRDAATPGTVLSTQSAFLRNDGVILSLDGTENPVLKDAPGTGFVGINHRNHLSINTSSALNLGSTGFDIHDFSTGLGQAYDDTSVTTNDAMVDLGSGIFGLIRGDINSSNNVNVVDAALTKNSSFPIISGYNKYDINFNGTVNVIDAAIVKAASFPIKTGHIQ